MRRPLVAGNWKMNGDSASITSLLEAVSAEFSRQPPQGCEVLVFPTHVYLQMVVGLLEGVEVGVGAQDVDHRPPGAVTGAVSAAGGR